MKHQQPFNQQLLFTELKSRGVKVSQLPETPFFSAKYGSHQEWIFDLAGSSSDYPSSWIVGDKFYTKQVLKLAGLPVAEGKVFRKNETEAAQAYAHELGFPVVLKPITDGQGNFVFAELKTADELVDALYTFKTEYHRSEQFLLEKYVPGQEYRLLVTRRGFIAAVNRQPAQVVGDGVNSLLKLIQIENYQRMNPRTTCLCQIQLDEMLFNYLDTHQRRLDQVPAKDEVVQLRANSNVSKGGNCYDVTDVLHPSVRKLADKVFRALPGLSWVGIDLICEDISRPLNKQRHIICELNVAPGLSLHTMPERGWSQPTPQAVADTLFPETT